MKSIKTVDDYIASAPKELQPRLTQLRNTIKSVAPNAQEKISYSMPYYGYKGRLVYFGLFTHHIGLYIPGSVVEDHQTELRKYKTARATIRFPHDQKLPLALVKKLIKARVKANDAFQG